MIKLKNLLKEEEATINEAKNSPFYSAGWQSGPNGKGKLDTSTKEGKFVESKANQLYELINDKDLIEFTKGYFDSLHSYSNRYNGLSSVAKLLVYMKNKK